MKKTLFAAVMLVAFGSAPVLAADMAVKAAPAPVAAAYNWTGFYLGIEGGWARSNQDWTAVGGVTTGNFRGDGGLFGGTVGYNKQFGTIVAGIEGDFSGANIRATDTTTGGCSVGLPCTAKVDSLGTIRGRLGVAADRFLFYVTGGGAFADVHNSQLLLSPLATASQEKTGWTLGGGIEAALTGNWSVKAEYLHADFGQTPFCPAAGCVVVVVSNYTRLDIVRAGLNYKFPGM